MAAALEGFREPGLDDASCLATKDLASVTDVGHEVDRVSHPEAERVLEIAAAGQERSLQGSAQGDGGGHVTANGEGVWDAHIEFTSAPAGEIFTVRITSSKGEAVYEFNFKRIA